jgi:predicted metal-binding protein
MSLPDRDRKVQALIDLALERGAAAVLTIAPSSVVTAEWVRLKCQFGCPHYNRCLTCPPYSPTPATMRQTIDGYATVILVHMQKEAQRLRKLMLKLERQAFLMGFHRALGFGVGPCHVCDDCDTSTPCLNGLQARPSMECSGIDVYTTARNNGFFVQVLTSRDETPNYFALLLVD